MATVAWAAGFIDGEGSFGAYGRNHDPRIVAVQVHREPLDELGAAFGGQVSERGRSSPDRDQYVWTVAGSKQCLPVAEELIPHLRLKRQEAMVLRDLCAHAVAHASRSRSFDETPTGRRERLAPFAARLKALKENPMAEMPSLALPDERAAAREWAERDGSLALLRRGPINATDAGRALGITTQAARHRFLRLVEAGLLKRERVGPVVLYELEASPG